VHQKDWNCLSARLLFSIFFSFFLFSFEHIPIYINQLEMNHDETISLSNIYIYIYASSTLQFNLLYIFILVINPHYQRNTLKHHFNCFSFFFILNHLQLKSIDFIKKEKKERKRPFFHTRSFWYSLLSYISHWHLSNSLKKDKFIQISIESKLRK